MIEASSGPFDRRFLVQRGVGHAALVTIALDLAPPEPFLAIACDGVGWVRQGTSETATADGYADWKAGARIGAAYALRVADLPRAGVRVLRIEGMTSDTNPTIVAAAAARAVWLAAGFTPSLELRARLDAVTLASWTTPTALPVLDES